VIIWGENQELRKEVSNNNYIFATVKKS